MKKEIIPYPRESRTLDFLYHTVPGRAVLKLLTARPLSTMCGIYLDSAHSAWLNKSFLEKNGIDLSEYEPVEYRSFNECFSRKIRPELRPIDREPSHLIAPCDGLLSAYRITEQTVIPCKQSSYSIARLLKSKKLAARYTDGTCLVFRLCVNHYHRYSYIETGKKTENYYIPGILHTVQPVALAQSPVFTENSREYTVIRTEQFGDIVQMEVGAMLVGKIKNYHGKKQVTRGEEKGCFLYGGSTIIVLLEKDRVELPDWLYEATEEGGEVPVKLGEMLGTSVEAGATN